MGLTIVFKSLRLNPGIYRNCLCLKSGYIGTFFLLLFDLNSLSLFSLYHSLLLLGIATDSVFALAIMVSRVMLDKAGIVIYSQTGSHTSSFAHMTPNFFESASC